MKFKVRFLIIAVAILLAVTTMIVAIRAYAFKPHECTIIEEMQAATCLHPSRIKYFCEECGKITYSNTGSNSLEHNYGEPIELVAPLKGKDGRQIENCKDCGASLISEIVCLHIEKTEKITKQPYKSEPGEMDLICTRCGLVESVTFECTHPKTTVKTVVKQTCTSDGYTETVCTTCANVLSTATLKALGHSLTNETVLIKPTPLSKGKSNGTCTNCNKYLENVDTIWVSKWDDAIYIPTAKVESELYEGKCDQATVDAHDVVINFTRIKKTEPLILGHDYGPLGKMYKAKNGEYVYVVHNSKLKVYKIISSEMGMKYNNNYDIVAVDDLESIFTPYNRDVIHLYTCYGAYNWLIWAERDLEAEKNLVADYNLAN